MKRGYNEQIDIHNYSITDIFQRFYVVPDYQREYVSTEKNYGQLLEDIANEYSDGKDSEYFIGSIVVCQRKEDRRYDVIDGQQRLTTLFVCLAAFKKLLEKENVADIQNMLYAMSRSSSGLSKYNYKLELQYKESSQVIQKITEEEKHKEWFSKMEQEYLSTSSQKIFDAYIYAKEYIQKNFSGNEKISAFLGYFVTNVKLIEIETPEVNDALKIFETINARGVSLDSMDLLKNLIFRNVDQRDFDKLKVDWKSVISTLVKMQAKNLFAS